MQKGQVSRVSGPVAVAEGITPKMNDVVLVGKERLVGEVIKLIGDKTVIQVYEDTSGMRPGEEVLNTGDPLQVELGPGLLSSIYDGVQRPLPVLMAKMGDFVKRGAQAAGLDREKKWRFTPKVKEGDEVHQGSIIGEVPEGNITHRILVPSGVSGKVKKIKSGDFTVEEVVCELEGGAKLTMMQKWAVRISRPYSEKLLPDIPLQSQEGSARARPSRPSSSRNGPTRR